MEIILYKPCGHTVKDKQLTFLSKDEIKQALLLESKDCSYCKLLQSLGVINGRKTAQVS